LAKLKQFEKFKNKIKFFKKGKKKKKKNGLPKGGVISYLIHLISKL